MVAMMYFVQLFIILIKLRRKTNWTLLTLCIKIRWSQWPGWESEQTHGCSCSSVPAEGDSICCKELCYLSNGDRSNCMHQTVLWQDSSTSVFLSKIHIHRHFFKTFFLSMSDLLTCTVHVLVTVHVVAVSIWAVLLDEHSTLLNCWADWTGRLNCFFVLLLTEKLKRVIPLS